MTTVVCADCVWCDVLYGRGCVIPLLVERMVFTVLALLWVIGSISVVVFGFYFLVSHFLVTVKILSRLAIARHAFAVASLSSVSLSPMFSACACSIKCLAHASSSSALLDLSQWQGLSGWCCCVALCEWLAMCAIAKGKNRIKPV